MQTNNWFVILAVLCGGLLLLVTKAHAACVCGLEGTDQCAGCTGNTIIRPKPKPFAPGLPLPLPPIGDNCWCNRQSVEPAALPKPCEKLKSPNCACKKAKALAALGYAAPPIYNNPPLNYYAPLLPLKDDSPPADPVSVSLALKAGKTIGVPEAKLSFGFVQQPLDGLQKIEFSNVPEENLFQLKNEIIELKKLPTPLKKLEEELLIAEEEEEEALAEAPPLLTYKQLGYDIAELKIPKFRKVLPPLPLALAAANYYNLKPVYGTTVDCGFRPGRVTAHPIPSKTCLY